MQYLFEKVEVLEMVYKFAARGYVTSTVRSRMVQGA